MDEQLSKAKEYSRAKHSLAMLETVLYLLFFGTLIYTGLATYLADGIGNISGNNYIAVVLYVLTIGILLYIITFPLDYLSSFSIEHRFGLSKQSFYSWLKDYIKKVLIGGALYIVFILILYYFLRASENLWWLYTTLVYFFISVVLAKVFPLLIIPLFYRLTKVSESSLKGQLLSLAKRAGVRILDIYNIGLGAKTKKANAAVCGLGSTKRILLSDTLIQEYTADEIEATLAHELSHHKRQHFWKLSFYGFIFTLLGFLLINMLLHAAVRSGYLSSIHDIKALVLLAIYYLIYSILSTPILNSISRRYETEADREAITLTGKPTAFADLMRKLSLQNLSDPRPGFLTKIFFYDHPPAGERIRACGHTNEKCEKN